MKIISFVAIILGIIMIAYTGFNIITTENVVDLGPVHINRERNHWISWPPVVGVIFLAIGIVGIIVSARTSKK